MTRLRLPTLALALTLAAACDRGDDGAYGAFPGAGDVRTYRAVVVQSFPHDIDAFTQGLEYRDGHLYESVGREGRSALRRVDLRTGRVLQEHRLDDRYFAEGITIFGDRIFQLTWKHGKGFVYDRESFALLDSFSYTGEGWGLTNDGRQLIMSNGTSELRFLDPQTLRPTRSVTVTRGGSPVTYLNELEYIGGEVWANVWMSDWIVRIDPQSGEVVGMIDLQNLLPADLRHGGEDVLNGIAHDPETGRTFVTGKLWARVFEIDVVEQ